MQNITLNQFVNTSGDRVAIIDDVVENIRLLNRMLKDEGFVTYAFQSGRDAITSLSILPPDIILLDINMPDMDGYTTARLMKEKEQLREVPIIFISALSETQDKLSAFQAGGVDYITKPFVLEEVRARVETHLKIARLQAALNQKNQELTRQLDKQYQTLIETQEKMIRLQNENLDAQVAIIEALVGFAEVGSAQQHRPIKQVQTACARLLGEMRRNPAYMELLNEEFMRNFLYAAALYDIGMAGMTGRDEHFLHGQRNKQGAAERHTTIGALMLYKIIEKFPENEMLKMAVEMAQNHHENYDGSGYPQGIKGQEIPLVARVIAVVDAYFELVGQQRYSPQGALHTIRGIWSPRFDPDVVQAFAAVAENGF